MKRGVCIAQQKVDYFPNIYTHVMMSPLHLDAWTMNWNIQIHTLLILYFHKLNSEWYWISLWITQLLRLIWEISDIFSIRTNMCMLYSTAMITHELNMQSVHLSALCLKGNFAAVQLLWWWIFLSLWKWYLYFPVLSCRGFLILSVKEFSEFMSLSFVFHSHPTW